MSKHLKLKIYTDGGARGNPGPAGVGVVIMDENNQLISTHKKYLGEQTNNFAEYTAVILALEQAKELGAQEIEMFIDSELTVKQLNREYKVKNKDLAKLFVKVYNLTHQFKKVTFNHVIREKNQLADKLANQAMDQG